MRQNAPTYARPAQLNDVPLSAPWIYDFTFSTKTQLSAPTAFPSRSSPLCVLVALLLCDPTRGLASLFTSTTSTKLAEGAAMATTTLPWHPILPVKLRRCSASVRPTVSVQAFRRSDFDSFAQRMASGEAWRDAWRSANDGFEQLLFEAKKTAERIDRRYEVSRRLSTVTRSAVDRAREIDREFEIGMRWRSFTMDFSRNWPSVGYLFDLLSFYSYYIILLLSIYFLQDSLL